MNKNARLVLQLGRDTVIGFGTSDALARNDAFLTMLQTTTYRFKSKLPDDVVPVDDPGSLISLPPSITPSSISKVLYQMTLPLGQMGWLSGLRRLNGQL